MANINTGILFGGGQIPEANYLMGSLIEGILETSNGAVFGIKASYMGMAKKEDYERMTVEKARMIKNQSGTYFGTCRNFNPASDENFPKILSQLKAHGIHKLYFCGGDGTSRAGDEFDKKLKESGYEVSIYWVPCTIDGISGTESIGKESAVAESFKTANNIAMNAWATFDYGLKGPRVAVVELMGRNRDDILVATMKKIVSKGEIGNYKLDEILLKAIPSDHSWSIDDLLDLVNASEKPTMLLASEGAVPREFWFEMLTVKGVANRITAVIDRKKVKRANADVIGYMSQTNEESKKFHKKVDSWVKETIRLSTFPHMDAQAIVKNGNKFSTYPLAEIAKLNPNTKKIVPMSEEDKKFLFPYLP